MMNRLKDKPDLLLERPPMVDKTSGIVKEVQRLKRWDIEQMKKVPKERR